MSLRKEYEAAKASYHRAGNALAAAKSNRGERRAIYEKTKREYHRLGTQLAKKGK